MIFIIFIFFILFLHKGKMSANKPSIILIVLLASGIFANRSLSVPDTVPYLDMYEGIGTDNYELGYVSICEFFNSLGLSFSAFLFVISFVSLVIWFFITKRIISNKYIYLAFIIYLSYMGIYYHGIVLRACLAILINYLGIYYGLLKRTNYLVFYAFVCISMLFHISGLLFAILPLIIQRRYSTNVLYIVLLSSFLFMLFNRNLTFVANYLTILMETFSLYGGNRLGSYIENIGEATLSLTYIKYLMTGYALVYLSQYMRLDYENSYKFNMFLNIYVFGLILLFLLSFAPGSSRIAQLFIFFEFLPFTLLYEGVLPKKKPLVQILLIVIITTNFLSLLSLVPELWHYTL